MEPLFGSDLVLRWTPMDLVDLSGDLGDLDLGGGDLDLGGGDLDLGGGDLDLGGDLLGGDLLGGDLGGGVALAMDALGDPVLELESLLLKLSLFG